MRLRLKSKSGTKTITPYPAAPFLVLLSQIAEIEELNPSGSGLVAIKHGFPPKPIDLKDEKTSTIAAKGIKDGDQLILEFGEGGGSQSVSSATTKPKSSQQSQPENNGVAMQYLSPDSNLFLRNIPDDNSCLFNAIVHAAMVDAHPLELRSVVANHIRGHPETYTEVILGQEPGKYCDWIIKKDSWGGAIELEILAEWFNIRIECLDIELCQFILFGKDQSSAPSYIVLIYSGIHYDYVAENAGGKDITSWPVESTTVLAASKKLGKKLQSQDYATNTTTFRVRCLVCYEVLVGEMGASKHAEKTGHYSFGEVK
ncbi:uncharacterized protein CANTADRAFT_56033 [Suhomyces tanzawaensis NRRL Y-17324]|uniref:Ubiquitin thioesterase OTU n=1 Tax=Suhomyces tanzawaensis NRRL Y-17324 TaxID=984487 RepID=A0A1E4SD33_9ASCO|nr:uncharacterized protein CANTADRAFT_56033 [Suhomyces tanzawaensis NRRL Y-17324]ODV77415.1 hypothetical protein CANTADRAFT_56033 [Suhomyces tanzawaensis NRRL Y-17324]